MGKVKAGQIREGSVARVVTFFDASTHRNTSALWRVNTYRAVMAGDEGVGHLKEETIDCADGVRGIHSF